MDRNEHLQWCKDRALEYLTKNNIQDAFTSFQSDMGKHKETQDHVALGLGAALFFSGQLNTVSKMREWIEGF